MRTTSSDSILHMKDLNLTQITSDLVCNSPTEFDKAVIPLRRVLETFNEDGAMSKLMLHDNVTNHLVDGLYVRELLLPKGALVLSRVHKYRLINIISKGAVIVIDSDGYHEYTAPTTFVSKAGTQRVVFAVEETVWNTAHTTDETNPDELVDDLTFDNYEEFISYSNQLEHQE